MLRLLYFMNIAFLINIIWHQKHHVRRQKFHFVHVTSEEFLTVNFSDNNWWSWMLLHQCLKLPYRFSPLRSTTTNSSADALFSHKISGTLGGKRVYIRPADTKEKFSVMSSSWEICCRCVGMSRAHAVVFVKFLIFEKIKKRSLAEISSL